MATATNTKAKASDRQDSDPAPSENEAEQVAADTAPETPAVKRGSAAYADTANLAFMGDDDLPPETKGGRGDVYVGLLNAVVAACDANPENIGKWVPIAKFSTNQGANLVIKNIEKGKTNVPQGHVFEYTQRKYDRADGRGKGSQLFVRYMGPASKTSK